MRKINILFVMMQMEMGGSERLVHSLALKLDRDIFVPSIAWFYGERILKEFKNLEIPLYHIPKVKRFDISAMRRLAKIIKDNNINVVNAHHFMPMVYSFYGCKIKNHIKLIYTEHSEWEIKPVSWKWRKIGGYLLKRADGVVGVAENVSKILQNSFKFSPAKSITIRNGVDLEVFGSNRDKMTFKKELGIEDSDKVIGIVANFRKIKNHVFLLKAFNELIKEYKNVKLLLIGQGFEFAPENSQKKIEHFIKENGLNNNVLSLGYRSNIPELLSIMDIFCLTSLKEGLPISLIEAMAAGLPVVGTDVEGIRDVIVPNRNGFLVQIEDVKGLKNVLYRLLKNESLRHKMGHESKSLAKDTYSLDQCINHYQDLFISIMEKKM